MLLMRLRLLSMVIPAFATANNQHSVLLVQHLRVGNSYVAVLLMPHVLQQHMRQVHLGASS